MLAIDVLLLRKCGKLWFSRFENATLNIEPHRQMTARFISVLCGSQVVCECPMLNLEKG